MKRFHAWVMSSLVALTWTCSVGAQSAGDFQVAKVFATLETSVDTLTNARDDTFTLITMNDVGVGGRIVIPKGSKIVGHVVGVTNKGRDASKSVLALSIDNALTKSGDIPLQAIIVAVAAPKKSDTDATVSTSKRVSNQPKSGTPARPQLSPGDVTLLLSDDDQGAYGFEDVTISWHLSIPPPLTILATRGKRLKLDAGTQVLLRMMPPKPTK
jgi:hypothetical protein